MHIALSFLDVSSLGCISRSTVTESSSMNIFLALELLSYFPKC